MEKKIVNDIKGFVLAITNIQYLNKFDYINYIGNKNSKKKFEGNFV
jgi:hypothetical protein